ncbi:MAG TPA: TetR/AcrR family transcriptional regulator [Acidimicrobiales bacterium]
MARATPTGATGARSRRPSDHVTRDLLDAAAVEFAAHGFAGASTRRIAERAGAHQPQINYHFTSKEQLWRATVDHLFSLMDAELPGLGDGPTTDAAFAAVVRSFVRFSADRPELDRIINLEATAPSPRLDWLVATHLQPRFAAVSDGWTALRAAGHGADLTAGEAWEVLTSFGAMHFANAPMLTLLGIHGGDGRIEADAHAERILAILMPTTPRGPTASG